ncbi:uncharacterized protein LOC111346958 [Stylophora pistillata]|uniref:uncharacterized protein LOC111346958 n=1 Tax=Stylophora pistillata TaxID=50429 RepID=UPI000C03F562|nr:uncharacterized protein LOC111346958 [Stylophora pistillata]
MNEMAFLSKEELRRKMETYSGRRSLYLSGHSLHELPAALFELTELEELFLSENKLTTIPENMGKLNNLTVLIVRRNQLSVFPTSLTQLKKLKELNIRDNKLTTIPDGIGEMVELEGLELSFNQLTVLSPAIKQLKKLKWLDISHNNLTTIPDAIGEMVELGRLVLSGNQLTVLSPAIKHLKNLKVLNISHNNLTTIPDVIGEMVELEGLVLSYNQLTVLSPAIKHLKKLRELDMSYNNLTTIPDVIGEMVELERLVLSYNRLTELSPAIKQLKKLKDLSVYGNLFTVEGMRSVMELKDKIYRVYSVFPDHVDRQRAQGPAAQLAYEEALKDGYVQVYRGRVILVGQDRAGKTSLKKSLLGLPFDPKEQSTQGIEVDPSKCEIDVDQAVKNWQLTRENKPGLLECSKDVAKIVVGRMCGADISQFLKEETIDGGQLELKDEVEDVFKSKQVEEGESFRDIVENHGNEYSTECKDENMQAEPDVMIDVSRPPDTEEHVYQWLEYAQGKPTESALFTEEPYVTMDVWDFAGQHLYYAKQHLSEDPKEWAKAIAGVRQKERLDRLHEIQQLRSSYEEKFNWEKQCDILVEKMWDIVRGCKRRDINFRTQEGEDVDTSTKQLTVDSSLTPSSLDRIIQKLQQMRLDAGQVKRRTDLSLGLRNIASDKGFRIFDNQESGNCMFYALSEQLDIVEKIYIPPCRLRLTLVQYLRRNPELPDGTDLFHFVHGHQTWTEYLTHMEQDGAWGDHVILYAAANCYETCIRVVSSLPHSNDVLITPHCSVDESKALVLGHIHELHYVSLQPAQG